jgi:hypothetical protein
MADFVNFVLPSGDVRPFLVIVRYDNDLIDGQLFRNGANDDRKDNGRGELTVWKQSVKKDDLKRPNTWHERG